jgi:hypothetical protein
MADATEATTDAPDFTLADLDIAEPASEGNVTPASAQESPQLVTVKVNGAERQITLEEAVNGYQRQEDYTRKTQEVAQERARLTQAEKIFNALVADPAATIALLQETYGIGARAEAEDGFDDPVEARLRPIEQAFAQQQQQAQVAAIHQQVQSLTERYGEFDVNAVIQHAIRKGGIDVETAYRDLMFDNVLTDAQLVARARQQRQQARDAAKVVASGSTNSGVVAPASATPGRVSLSDALAAAIAEHST